MESFKELANQKEIDFSADDLEYIENQLKLIPPDKLPLVSEQVIYNYQIVREHFKHNKSETIDEIARFNMRNYLKNVTKLFTDENKFLKNQNDFSWTMRLF